jgi:hypothetical protein
VRRLFGELLPHTPVSAVGINFHVFFRLTTAEHRIAFGRALAPLEPWGTFGKRLAEKPASPKTASGMISIAMQENAPGGRRGWRRVEVQPAQHIDALRGVYVAVNDHFDVANVRPEDGAAAVMEIIRREFDASEAEYRRIVADLMDFAGRLA